jgi:hypothetical protein
LDSSKPRQSCLFELLLGIFHVLLERVQLHIAMAPQLVCQPELLLQQRVFSGQALHELTLLLQFG